MVSAKPFPWGPVAAVIAVAAVAAVALLRFPASPPRGEEAPHLPTVGVTKPDPAGRSVLLAEKLAAYDPTALFLPAPLNSGESVLPARLRPEAGVPADTVPDRKLVFSPDSLAGGDLAVQFSDPVAPPADAVEGLKLAARPEVPLALGRTDWNLSKLRPRAGWVEAVAADSGRVVWAGDLGAAPAAAGGDWQPLELLGTVASAGLVGDLVVTTSSGSDEVDRNVRQQRAQGVRVGARLSPGRYTFRVGP